MGIPYAEVIGDPIAHSLSPLIHKFWLATIGLEGDYRAARITPAELGRYFADRLIDPDWRGCNITMPHKLAALSYAPHRAEPSFPPEPINLAVRHDDGGLIGHAFDTTGFVEPLLNLAKPRGGRAGAAIVLGAGGAARAVILGLAHFGYAPIRIVSRSAERAEALARDYARVGASAAKPSALPAGARILVNASAMGMLGRPDPPMLLDRLDKDAIVYDLVYAPAETALLREARARGFRTIDGLAMLVGQAAPSFHALFGAAAPRDHDAALRELLAR